jgi:hypothetical protein
LDEVCIFGCGPHLPFYFESEETLGDFDFIARTGAPNTYDLGSFPSVKSICDEEENSP